MIVLASLLLSVATAAASPNEVCRALTRPEETRRHVELNRLLEPFIDETKAPSAAESRELLASVFCGSETHLGGLEAAAVDVALKVPVPEDVAESCRHYVLRRPHSLLRPLCVDVALRNETGHSWVLGLLADERDPQVTRRILPLLPADDRLAHDATPLVVAMLHRTANQHVLTDAAIFLHHRPSGPISRLLLMADAQCNPELRRNLEKDFETDEKEQVEQMCTEMFRPRKTP